MPRVIVIGCGVAGTVVANRLVRSRRGLEVRVIDGHGDHVYQPGSLGVALGRLEAARLRRDARGLLAPSVGLEVSHVEGIDVAARRIDLAGGRREPYDVLVVATGSRVDRSEPPGFREANHDYHCPRAAAGVAERLARFEGGRIVVGAVRLPYKCPPSPIEFGLLLDEWLRGRGIRQATRITYLYPLPDVYPDPEVACWSADLMRERGVEIVVPFRIASIDPAGRRVVSDSGAEIDYDLLLLVPPHRGSEFLVHSGLGRGIGGWVPVDRATLRAAEGIFCLGDAADLPVPKSGSAARYQARVVVENVLAELQGRPLEDYSGRATFLVETARRRATRIDSDSTRPPRRPRRPNLVDYALRRAFDRLYFPILARA